MQVVWTAERLGAGTYFNTAVWWRGHVSHSAQQLSLPLLLTIDATACCLDDLAVAEADPSHMSTINKAWIQYALCTCQTPPRYTSLAMPLLLLQELHTTPSRTSGWTVVKCTKLVMHSNAASA